MVIGYPGARADKNPCIHKDLTKSLQGLIRVSESKCSSLFRDAWLLI